VFVLYGDTDFFNKDIINIDKFSVNNLGTEEISAVSG
jgi:hypothetical protein